MCAAILLTNRCVRTHMQARLTPSPNMAQVPTSNRPLPNAHPTDSVLFHYGWLPLAQKPSDSPFVFASMVSDNRVDHGSAQEHGYAGTLTRPLDDSKREPRPRKVRGCWLSLDNTPSLSVENSQLAAGQGRYRNYNFGEGPLGLAGVPLGFPHGGGLHHRKSHLNDGRKRWRYPKGQ